MRRKKKSEFKFWPEQIAVWNKMFICTNAECPRSYLSEDGQMVVNLVQALRTMHDANAKVTAPLALKERAPLIYQNGEPPCAGCGQVEGLIHHTGPDQPGGVNTLLQNIELLQIHGVLSG